MEISKSVEFQNRNGANHHKTDDAIGAMSKPRLWVAIIMVIKRRQLLNLHTCLVIVAIRGTLWLLETWLTQYPSQPIKSFLSLSSRRSQWHLRLQATWGRTRQLKKWTTATSRIHLQIMDVGSPLSESQPWCTALLRHNKFITVQQPSKYSKTTATAFVKSLTTHSSW